MEGGRETKQKQKQKTEGEGERQSKWSLKIKTVYFAIYMLL
jgi:hypothetical protein